MIYLGDVITANNIPIVLKNEPADEPDDADEDPPGKDNSVF